MKKKLTTKLIDGVLYDAESGEPIFTEEMRKTHKILVPTMLPIHFTLIQKLLKLYGYDAEFLDYHGTEVAETGLKYVHNDTCYPATLVIGELIQAVQSGKYDTHKIALLITQTGGGCRASNYIYLLKKALKKAGYGYIPVISLNFSGLKTQPGFKFSLMQFYGMLKCCVYGDLLMLLRNQCKPYEVKAGETDGLVNFWVEKLGNGFKDSKNLKYKTVKANMEHIITSFAKIKKTGKVKPKVGIVGEIFVKYSPLGNNDLEDFLMSEGAEVYVPGLLDFMLYFVYNNLVDTKLYKVRKKVALISKIAYKFLLSKEQDIIDAINKEGSFMPPTLFSHTVKMIEGYISEGVKMGEGWLLTAEMLELIEKGIPNIVCTQPFGCLPNHIVGKGMLKEIRERNPEANIIAIDYDASASKINQENRIKLMLSNALEKLNS